MENGLVTGVQRQVGKEQAPQANRSIHGPCLQVRRAVHSPHPLGGLWHASFGQGVTHTPWAGRKGCLIGSLDWLGD